MTRAPVRVVVDRLVLDGLALDGADPRPAQIDAVVAALTVELRRCVLDGPGRAAAWRSAPALVAPTIYVAPGTPAAQIGQRAGAAVHAALDGSGP